MTIRTVADLKRALPEGTRLAVTNHYITREDHPCYGTRTGIVLRANGSRFYLDAGGKESPIDWPKASRLRQNEDGSVTITGGGIRQAPDDPFLTLRWLTDAEQLATDGQSVPVETTGGRQCAAAAHVPRAAPRLFEPVAGVLEGQQVLGLEDSPVCNQTTGSAGTPS